MAARGKERASKEPGRKLKMKELERATGVGRESIRFYIREGLLPEPERPGRNVAWYDESFIERIALVKKLQTERFLPLSVIKGIVAGDQMPSDAEVRTLLDIDLTLTSSRSDSVALKAERLSALAKRVGLSAREVLAMGKVDAIAVVTRDGAQWVEAGDIALVERWAEARRAGFSEELGYGPETLRMYVEFVRWLVREELRQFTASVTGKVDGQRLRTMAETGVVNSGEMLRLIHERVLREAIARGNLPQAPAEPTRRDAASE